MGLGQFAGYGQAKPCAAAAARPGKGLEQISAHLVWHAGACIAQADKA